MPRTLRVLALVLVSGSLDYLADLGALGDEWRLGLDVVWSRARDASNWTDLRSVPLGTLPDGRIRYQVLPNGEYKYLGAIPVNAAPDKVPAPDEADAKGEKKPDAKPEKKADPKAAPKAAPKSGEPAKEGDRV